MAILDGWALAADSTLGAGGYSPVLLAAMPQRVEAGQPMPPGTDCVAAFDAVKVTGGRAEALDTVNPGDGVLPAGADCDGKTPLRRAGDALRSLDGAVFAAAGISHVSVREPRIMVLPLREGDVVDAAVGLVGGDIESRGGAGHLADCGRKLATALATDNVDAIVAIGGTGQGRNDTSVQTLARRRPPGRARHRALARRNRRVRFCRSAARAAAAGTARRGVERLARGRAAHAGAARRRPRS